MFQPYIFKKIKDESYAVPNKFYWKEISQKKYQILLKRSGIPNFYWDIGFSDYVGEISNENVKKIQYMCNNIHDEKFKYVNLYLWGSETGTQKSAVACNFGKECIRQGLYVKFMLFGSFVNHLMKLQGFHRDEESNEKIEESVAKATYVKSRNIWKIFWQRADLKWHRYQPDPEVKTLEEFLYVVERDEYCCFYG